MLYLFELELHVFMNIIQFRLFLMVLNKDSKSTRDDGRKLECGVYEEHLNAALHSSWPSPARPRLLFICALRLARAHGSTEKSRFMTKDKNMTWFPLSELYKVFIRLYKVQTSLYCYINYILVYSYLMFL